MSNGYGSESVHPVWFGSDMVLWSHSSVWFWFGKTKPVSTKTEPWTSLVMIFAIMYLRDSRCDAEISS